MPACAGGKASVYDGGIHVPCYIRWPGHFPAGRVGRPHRRPHRPDSHVARRLRRGRLRPAYASTARACFRCFRESRPPAGPIGPSFSSGIAATGPSSAASFAARTQRYKLLRHEPPLGSTKTPPLQLFDMERDPLELHDIAERAPRDRYQDVRRLQGVVQGRVIDPRIRAGPDRAGKPAENPTILTPQDWRGPRADGQPNALGYWEVDVARAGRFDVKLRFTASPVPLHGPHCVRRPTRRDQTRAGSDRVLVQGCRSARRPRAAGSLDRREPNTAASSM